MRRAVFVAAALLAALTLTACEEPAVGTKSTTTACKLDDQPAVPCKSPVQFPDLPLGPHHVTVYATVWTYQGHGRWTAGPTGTDERSWTVVSE